jgi:hypothetical protein
VRSQAPWVRHFAAPYHLSRQRDLRVPRGDWHFPRCFPGHPVPRPGGDPPALGPGVLAARVHPHASTSAQSLRPRRGLVRLGLTAVHVAQGAEELGLDSALRHKGAHLGAS